MSGVEWRGCEKWVQCFSSLRFELTQVCGDLKLCGGLLTSPGFRDILHNFFLNSDQGIQWREITVSISFKYTSRWPWHQFDVCWHCYHLWQWLGTGIFSRTYLIWCSDEQCSLSPPSTCNRLLCNFCYLETKKCTYKASHLCQYCRILIWTCKPWTVAIGLARHVQFMCIGLQLHSLWR
jgi:hypothetical protein